jgi:chromosome segregation ATPase
MPPKSLSEKVDELTRTVIELAAALKAMRAELERLAVEVERTKEKHEPIGSRIAVLEREVAELKAHRDEWGRRAWSLVVPIVTAIVGGVVGYLLKR